ncbi:hypothetical protein AB0K57_05095 [Streptomyces halstedii]|uniref:hypothetical protein n=1 Tax=Streptomyces halstedii TaxID=1944 RepID=UPI0034602833
MSISTSWRSLSAIGLAVTIGHVPRWWQVPAFACWESVCHNGASVRVSPGRRCV